MESKVIIELHCARNSEGSDHMASLLAKSTISVPTRGVVGSRLKMLKR